MNPNKRIFVAGHNGMVGSAVCRALQTASASVTVANRAQLDLCDQRAVYNFFQENQFDEVYIAAAKVGGIKANSEYPAEFIRDNLLIQSNIIHGAHLNSVQRLLFLGSSCIYPRLATQPMNESELLTGELEPTNEPYAVAKIAGIKMCESYSRQYGRDYRSVMPTNLYGPGDNFHPENSHVIPALIRRFETAVTDGVDEIDIWGSGTPRREFLHVDDMAAACVFVMNLERSNYVGLLEDGKVSHLNIGTGEDCSIRELVELLITVSGYTGKVSYDNTKPDGAPRKLLDVSRIRDAGWSHNISLQEGLQTTWTWFCNNKDTSARV